MVDSVVEELARKRLGRTIKGKWRLDRLLGVGGMAAVYAATHRNGARVAIKMLHATISASQQIRARFVREGYLANKVDHPGVVRVLDDDIDDQDQAAFLVMDLVLGSTLSDRAMERLLNDGEVLDVAEQVLQVLASAHKQGIIHRDLKPDNLLVDNVGKVHVLDFGIARLLDDATGNVSATKTGTAFGTPGFMAPEQALGKQHLITAKTDLYALGATLFALVCGDFVHAAENPQELMVLVATQPARSLGELAPHMARDVIALIDRATRNEPDQRWPSAEAMLAEVRRVKAKLGITSSPVLPLKNGDSLDLTPPPHVWASPPAPGAKQPTTPNARATPPRPTPRSASGNVVVATPGKPPPRVDTSPGVSSPGRPAPPMDLSPTLDGDDLLESVPSSPNPPAGRFGEPEVMAQLRNSTPAASFDARAPTPLGALESGMQTPVAPNRRRMGTVIAVVGTAALLGVIAIAVSSTRGRPTSTASDHPSESPTQPTTTKAPTADTTGEAATATAATETTAGAPTTTTTSTATVAGTSTGTTATAMTASTIGKPPGTLKGTATAPTGPVPTIKASTTASVKKPIDVGY